MVPPLSKMNLLNGTITADNLEKVCKICFDSENQTFHMSAYLEFNNLAQPAITIFEILQKVTSPIISLDGNLPALICYNCLIELQNTYLFILKCEESSKLLQEFIPTLIKQESDTQNAKKPDFQPRKRKRKIEITVEKEKNNHHLCPVCFKEFSALDLREHAHTHKALKKYLTIPEKSKVKPSTKFSTTRHLTNPKVTLMRQENITHKCPYCDEYLKIDEFRIHVETHRHQNEYKCDKCERVFKKINHLNTHRLKHLKEYPYECPHCGKGFVIKKNFDCHVLAHTGGESPYQCKICLKRFTNPEHLKRHQTVHTDNVTYSVKYRVCRCHHCLRTFKDKSELKAHSCVPIRRTKNRQYPCKSCDKVFKHPSGLYTHNRNIHKLGPRKVLCSVCGAHVSNIYNHMFRHTGQKPFPCNQCEKRFSSKPQLNRHLLVHSGLKPFVCSVCAKAFNNLYNLQVHERIHSGIKRHICHICNKGFLERSYLKKHLHIHEKQ